MEEIKVSIFCLTYNHKEYIRDTFEGFLKQKVDFLFDVFVFDDASNDGTSDIVREYQKKYPNIFRAYISVNNTYGLAEREDLLINLSKQYINGKYVAWCEGDDFWIDSRKLQIQVDYMEAHPECFMVAHNAIEFDYQNHSMRSLNPYAETRKIMPEEIILRKNGNLPTASLLYRNEITAYAGDFPRCDVYDWPLQLLAMTKGEIHYIDRIMSVYRYMHSGSWSKDKADDNINFMRHRLGMIDFLNKYDEYTNRMYHNTIVVSQNRFFNDNIFECGVDSIEDYYLQCELLNKKTDYIYSDYIENQKYLYRMFFDATYINDNLKKYIETHKRVVVMGTGKFSKIISQQLKHVGIEIEGYVLSNDQFANNSDIDKPVWRLNEYPYSYQETGVIVAVNFLFALDILRNLKNERITDYFLPYLIGDIC